MKGSQNKEESKRELYEHLKKAVKTSLRFLKGKVEKENINLLHDYDFKINEKLRTWEITPNLSYPLGLFAKMNFEEIFKLPAVVSCVDFLVKNEFDKMLEIKKEFMSNEVIGDFLMQYVDRTQGFDYDESTFNSLYKEFEEYIYTEGREIIAIAPLLSFELEGAERIDLGGSVIRKITEGEFKMLLYHQAFEVSEFKMLFQLDALRKPLLSPRGPIFFTYYMVCGNKKKVSKQRKSSRFSIF